MAWGVSGRLWLISGEMRGVESSVDGDGLADEDGSLAASLIMIGFFMALPSRIAKLWTWSVTLLVKIRKYIPESLETEDGITLRHGVVMFA